jgi:hypothetical protein
MVETCKAASLLNLQGKFPSFLFYRGETGNFSSGGNQRGNYMETRSIKALSMRLLQGNWQGNQMETQDFPVRKLETRQETGKETVSHSVGAVEIIPLPCPRAWLTEKGDLMTSGHFPDLETEIAKLTMDNLPLQRQLLEQHCESFDRHHIGDRWEEWEERAAIMEYDGGLTREEAEIEAARQMNLLAFMAERKISGKGGKRPEME